MWEMTAACSVSGLVSLTVAPELSSVIITSLLVKRDTAKGKGWQEFSGHGQASQPK